MNKKIPTLSIKDLALLKSNPKEYYMKKLEEDNTRIDEETSTVKHPVTERARNVGATGKKSANYEKDGESYFDVTYRDGTKLTYHAGEEGEYIGSHEESQTIYIEADDDMIERAEWAEPFALTDALEEEIDTLYPELAEDGYYISDEPEFDGEGFSVPITVDVSEYSEKSDPKLVSVTTPDGEVIDYLVDKGSWHENVTIEMTPKLKEAIEDLENGYPIPWNDRAEQAIHDQLGYEDVWAGDLIDYDDNSVTLESEFTKVYFAREYQGSEYEKLSDREKSDFDYLLDTVVKSGGMTDKIRNDYSEGEGNKEIFNTFENVVANNNLGDTDSFITIQNIQNLPENEGVGKAIVRNNDYNMEHISTDIEEVMKEKGDGWTIITLHEKGNPASNGASSHGKFVTAPGQKNERYLIDEERRTIVQRPYQPGMDRHIWG